MTIPRADFLTDVTPEHPILHLAMDRFWDRPAKLNREIADALAPVDHIGPDDRVGGTRVNAARARATMIRNRRIGLELEVEDLEVEHREREGGRVAEDARIGHVQSYKIEMCG